MDMGGENLLVYDRGLIGYAKILQSNSNASSGKQYGDLVDGDNNLVYSQFYAWTWY